MTTPAIQVTIVESLACDIAAVRQRINTLHDKMQLILSVCAQAEAPAITPPETTPWFNARAQPPVRDGVYQTKGAANGSTFWRNYSTTQGWSAMRRVKADAYAASCTLAPPPYLWRGLDKES